MTTIAQQPEISSLGSGLSRRRARPGYGGASAALRPTPYVPPIARTGAPCVCGGLGPTAEETLCRPCRQEAIAQHGPRLARLLSALTYEHRDVRLRWAGPDTCETGWTPRVDFHAPHVLDPDGPPVLWHGLRYWEDDQLIAAYASGASDEQVLSLALAMAHYALTTIMIHEVGEWYTYRGSRVYPPHRPDPYLPHDEDNGPDGNGAIVLWLTYLTSANGRAEHVLADKVAQVASCPVRREDLGILPGQTLHLDAGGITVIPPASTTATTGAWTAPRHGEDPVTAALRDIHRTMVMSELTVAAQHLHLAGRPVLAPAPGAVQDSGRLAWDAHLTYDG
ncbi:hypothetical protein [Streptomyces sp. NPDC050585]|uniref:hypothetical protein n=1 Tax=Streptomyces sp. NPDC050585 TaxID=3365632 RepID=UPI003793522E